MFLIIKSYGHIAPLTQNGKIFCIFYIIIGVPLTILILESLVDRLQQRLMPSKTNKFSKTKSYSTINKSDGNSAENNQKEKGCLTSDNMYLRVFIFGILWLISVYLIPSLVFANLTELNWTLVDAFYYCFISITTIGFGDFVPGQNEVGWSRNIYRLLMTSKWLESLFNFR